MLSDIFLAHQMIFIPFSREQQDKYKDKIPILANLLEN